MRVTAFTCVFGETDPLRAPTVVNPRVRYVVLADQPQDVPPYQYVHVPGVDSLDATRLLSRRVKILADHPALGDPDVVLWHDAANELRCDPVALAGELLRDGREMIAFRHPHRDRIEDEAVAVASHGWADLDLLRRQVAGYRAEGFRDQEAITSTGFCFRRVTDRVRRFNKTWWREVERWCWRDQMSVDYALWKVGLKSAYVSGHYRDNPYAKWHHPC